MILLNLAMILFPAFLVWVVHAYLLHRGLDRRKKVFLLVLYFLIINAGTLGGSYLRGVHGLDFKNMTLSYRMKYLALGTGIAGMISFIVFILIYKNEIISKIRKSAMRFRHRAGLCGFYTKRFFSDMNQYTSYAVRAAKADLRAEVANSFLDWLWWLIEPFCMMLIYAFIFGIVMQASEQYFAIFIFSGLAFFNFFARGVTGSVEIIRANKGIITKIYLPKFVLLFSRMLVNGFKMLVSFGVVAVMMLVFRVQITINIIWILPIVAVLFILTFGMGTILMHFGVYVSDLSYIMGILINMLMYMSGIFYSMDKIPAPLGDILLRFNPMAFLITSMRNAILYGQAPDWVMLGIWAFVSVTLSALGVFTIYHNENAYVKVI